MFLWVHVMNEHAGVSGILPNQLDSHGADLQTHNLTAENSNSPPPSPGLIVLEPAMRSSQTTHTENKLTHTPVPLLPNRPIVRHDGAGGEHAHLPAGVREVPLLRAPDPGPVAPPGRGHGQGPEEELHTVHLLQRQAGGDREGEAVETEPWR